MAWQHKFADLLDDDVALSYLSITGSVLPFNQQWLTEKALEHGADWILFLEDDMVVRPEAVAFLLSRNQPIVGATYPKRHFPILFISSDRNGNEIVISENSTGIIEADHLGMGLTLIRRDVFEVWPVGVPTFTGEASDRHFCHQARLLDFPNYVDLDASRHVEHEGQYRFSWKDARPVEMSDLHYYPMP